MMKHEYENLGNGISIPCSRIDLTGSVDSPPRKELKEEIYGIIAFAGSTAATGYWNRDNQRVC